MRIQRRKRLSNWALGLILVVVVALASVYAYTKELPWTSKHTVQAVFTNAGNVRPASPVRIAGVNVGEVAAVEHLAADDQALAEEGAPEGEEGDPSPTATLVTMELEESALPLHTDATMKLRPRLFLEGNLFLDLKPGSPNAPEAGDGHVFPVSQTAVAVSIDQVLTALQSDVRTDLQILLHEFGTALDEHGGAEGLREMFRTSPGAYRYTSQVNEALLGQAPRDLSDLVVNLDSTVEALGRNEGELQDLVTNLRIVLGSFAAESDALEQGIAELPRLLEEGRPALASLNASFPAMRAFAREALPGVRSTPAMLDATTPWLQQLQGLMSRQELRGLTADLRPTIPDLARLARETIPFLDETRRLSSCFNEVMIPWLNDTVPDPDVPATGRVFEEFNYSLTGINGESRSGDANGPYFRVLAGGGTNTVVFPDPVQGLADPMVGVTPLPILGARPAIDSSAKTPFRPNAACERQEPPNLDSGQAGDPPQQGTVSPVKAEFTPEIQSGLEGLEAPLERAGELSGQSDARSRRSAKLYNDVLERAVNLLGDAYGMDYLRGLGDGGDAR